LVNNRDKLIAMFSKINASSIVDTVPTPTKKTDWHIPFEQYFKQHKKTSPNFYLKKSLYQKYGDNILVKPNRSTGEIEFEMWCEKCPTVSWVYRNGNKGVEFFSIVYHMALRRANFYPDYIIILKNGDIWIVEVKGGQKANGETENIDIYARSKFEALKDYVSEVNISNLHFGFVRYMGSQLYLSNTEWVDDLNDRNYWLPIEVFIK
jgi:type III restriction enzyme